MTLDEVKALALAIAKANGHPNPELYADIVVTNYVAPAPAQPEKGK